MKNQMSTDIQDYITRSSHADWEPLIEQGTHYIGVFVKSLRFDQTQQRSTTILLKFEPGSSYPHHNHPAGEELFVLSGSVTIETALLQAGDYLYTPPGFKHEVSSVSGCNLLLVVPEEVEKIPR